MSAIGRDFAKFPVKFPVISENGQSRGDSALPHQPYSPVSQSWLAEWLKESAPSGLFAHDAISSRPELKQKFRFGQNASARFLENSRFPE